MAARNDETIVIKKYANRRLYNTGTSTYVTLDDLADMVKRDEDFVVQDAKSGEDITHPVLTQIIFELENKNGQTMLPVKFLRQLIGFYGDHMQMIVPSFLEQSMIALVKEQERMREQMKAAFGASPMDMMKMQTPLQFIEEQTRRNMDMFNNAIRLFTPKNGETGVPDSSAGKDAEQKAPGEATELDELREQIAAMQRKIEKLGK